MNLTPEAHFSVGYPQRVHSVVVLSVLEALLLDILVLLGLLDLLVELADEVLLKQEEFLVDFLLFFSVAVDFLVNLHYAVEGPLDSSFLLLLSLTRMLL